MIEEEIGLPWCFSSTSSTGRSSCNATDQLGQDNRGGIPVTASTAVLGTRVKVKPRQTLAGHSTRTSSDRIEAGCVCARAVWAISCSKASSPGCIPATAGHGRWVPCRDVCLLLACVLACLQASALPLPTNASEKEVSLPFSCFHGAYFPKLSMESTKINQTITKERKEKIPLGVLPRDSSAGE